MAKQLMGMLEADFDPTEYRDEYREQVLELVESKDRGEKPRLKSVKQKGRTEDLSAALAASLRAHEPQAAPRKTKAKRTKEKTHAGS